MDHCIQKISKDDVFLWPDETWCYREDAQEYDWKSDDFRVLPVGSPEWCSITEKT